MLVVARFVARAPPSPRKERRVKRMVDVVLYTSLGSAGGLLAVRFAVARDSSALPDWRAVRASAAGRRWALARGGFEDPDCVRDVAELRRGIWEITRLNLPARVDLFEETVADWVGDWLGVDSDSRFYDAASWCIERFWGWLRPESVRDLLDAACARLETAVWGRDFRLGGELCAKCSRLTELEERLVFLRSGN